MKIDDIRSIKLIDLTPLTPLNIKLFFKFEDYPGDIYYGFFKFTQIFLPRTTFALLLENKNSSAKSITISRPLLRLERNIEQIKYVANKNKQIELDDFTKKLLEKGTLDNLVVITTTQGKNIAKNRYTSLFIGLTFRLSLF
ncbi:MAG: hypothetical protein WD231_04745 [Candidatus Woykebacteria bacterium]